METIPYPAFNTLIMVGVVAMQIASVAIMLGLLRVRLFSRAVSIARTYAFTLSFLVVLGGIIGSLYYSEIAGFPACVLCWWQRVVIYPQLVLFGVAFWKEKRDVFLYTNILSAIGLLIGLYNVAIQSFPAFSAFCDPTSVTISCLEKYVEGFGYITIPIMSVTACIFLILVGWAALSKDRVPQPLV